jgi:hypothetical protein
MFLDYIKSIIIVITSILLSLMLAEFLLFSIGKYSNLVNSNFNNSNTVWKNKPLSLESMNHPDLGVRIYSNYDDKGIRTNYGNQLKKADSLIGFFGDSFLANRNIEYRFSISSLFNEFINTSKVVNFGVDGFGIEQSYQMWKNHSSMQLNDVVYFFTDNDLTDLENIILFTIIEDEDNFLLINNYEEKNNRNNKITLNQLLGKYRITYLFVDSYYQVRAIYFLIKKKYFSDISESALANFNLYRGELSERFHRENIAESDRKLIRKFNIILNNWKHEVEVMGSKFHIAILPRDYEIQLLPKILRNNSNEFNFIYLNGPKKISYMKDFQFTFRNDSHWNEIGNLAAISSLIDYFNLSGFSKSKEKFINYKFIDILNYYEGHKSLPY